MLTSCPGHQLLSTHNRLFLRDVCLNKTKEQVLRQRSEKHEVDSIRVLEFLFGDDTNHWNIHIFATPKDTT